MGSIQREFTVSKHEITSKNVQKLQADGLDVLGGGDRP